MDNKLQEIVNRILQVLIPEQIILFGSRAKGYAKECSDYDLLIIKSGIKNRLLIEQDIYEKLIGIDESIDILVRTPENIQKESNSVLKQAIKEGIIVYG